MITKIKLKNFQKYGLFELDLDERVTTLLGETEAGKTTIFRAFNWVFFNKPSGDSIVRHGKNDTIVQVIIDDHSIIRRKKKGFNGYILDGDKLEAIGSGKVPVPVQDIIDISPESFQHQLDQSFWLSETPGKIAKLLNKIVNLEVMDDTIANLQSASRKAKTVTEVSKQRLEDFREKRKKLEWVEDVAKSYEVIEQLQKEIGDKKESYGQLDDLIIDISDKRRIVNSYTEIDFTKANGYRNQITQLELEAKELASVLKEIRTIRGELCDLEESLREIEKELETVKTCPACGTSLS